MKHSMQTDLETTFPRDIPHVFPKIFGWRICYSFVRVKLSSGRPKTWTHSFHVQIKIRSISSCLCKRRRHYQRLTSRRLQPTQSTSQRAPSPHSLANPLTPQMTSTSSPTFSSPSGRKPLLSKELSFHPSHPQATSSSHAPPRS